MLDKTSVQLEPEVCHMIVQLQTHMAVVTPAKLYAKLYTMHTLDTENLSYVRRSTVVIHA